MEIDLSARLTKAAATTSLGNLEIRKPVVPAMEEGVGVTTTTVPVVIKTSTTNLICAICFKMNGRACRGCYSVAYCCREHQLRHWDIHQKVCRSLVTLQKEEVIRNLSAPPEERSEDPNVGMFKATRELKPKDFVVHLQPIMHAAHNKGIPVPPDSILCLGCNQWYQHSQGYRCTKCQWPVCSEGCETDSCHAKYECSVFSNNQILPPADPINYNGDILLALRCIMLKETNPADWEQLMAVQPVVEHAERPMHCLEADDKVAKFLMLKCRVQESLGITFPEVMNLLKVIDYCSVWLPERSAFLGDKSEFAFVSAKFVFPTKLYVGEECSPNCSWSLWYSPKLEECSIRLRASAVIQPGDYITASFSGISEYGATFSRRYDHFRFSNKCKCRRCLDPTEGGSFFSGVKCLTCKHPEQGYLLPEDPTDYNCLWHCYNSSCEGSKPNAEISSEMDRIHQEIQLHANSLQGLLNLIKANEKVRLHPNHYLIMRATQLSIDLCWGVLQNSNLSNIPMSLLEKSKSLTEKLAAIYKALHPWNSLENAKLLFHYQMHHGVSRVRELLWHYEQDRLKLPVKPELLQPNEFWDIVRIQKSSLDVLISEPFGSSERENAVLMQTVMEDTEALLVCELRDKKIQYETLMGLQNIYSRYCSAFIYPMLPVFEDKELNELVLFTGPYCRDMNVGGSHMLPPP